MVHARGSGKINLASDFSFKNWFMPSKISRSLKVNKFMKKYENLRRKPSFRDLGVIYGIVYG